ncbi:MAG: YjbE family putative metal transport protein [Hyphomicrobiales bacterium]|nr:YjbE family putative metal transport protein [Hyphomicrobiales bacterium]
MLTDLGGMIAPIGAAIEVAALNILLGADNAVLIALACQPLAAERRKRVLVSGVVGAVAFRFVLSLGAIALLASLPGLRLAGAVILIVIAMLSLTDFHRRAADMESPADNDGPGSSKLDPRFWQAVLAVIATDAVMSLDNIVATAAVAQGSAALILFGLVLGIPAVMFGSVLLTKVFDEWPILRLSGAVLLGWIAGQMAAADVLIGPWMARETPALANLLPALCACYVYVVGHGPTVVRCRAEAH